MCTIATWGFNFIVAQTFLSLGNLNTRQGVFYLYAVLAGLSFIVFARKVPETLGGSLEDIQAELISSIGKR